MQEQKISIIVAYSKNSKLNKNVIGFNKKIPWNIPEDQKRFKELTTNNVVIMGRITFEEIFEKLNGPLPNRINIIISSTKKFDDIGCKTFTTLEEALSFCKTKYLEKEIFICGGESIYKKSIIFATKFYITQIKKEFLGDRFFPLLNLNDFDIIQKRDVSKEIPYTYLMLEKKSSIR